MSSDYRSRHQTKAAFADELRELRAALRAESAVQTLESDWILIAGRLAKNTHELTAAWREIASSAPGAWPETVLVHIRSAWLHSRNPSRTVSEARRSAKRCATAARRFAQELRRSQLDWSAPNFMEPDSEPQVIAFIHDMPPRLSEVAMTYASVIEKWAMQFEFFYGANRLVAQPRSENGRRTGLLRELAGCLEQICSKPMLKETATLANAILVDSVVTTDDVKGALRSAQPKT